MLRAIDTELELLERSDGAHEVYGRIVPFGVTAHIRELDPTTGELDEYDEEFLPGCTLRIQQVAAKRGGAPGWIALTRDHLPATDLGSRLGYCTELHERDDGAWARFGLDRDPRYIDKILSMLATSHRGFSLEFADHPRPLTGPHRQRRSINIGAVTATPIPVYADAGITAMRAEAPLEAGTPRLDAVRAELEAQRARYATPATTTT